MKIKPLLAAFWMALITSILVRGAESPPAKPNPLIQVTESNYSDPDHPPYYTPVVQVNEFIPPPPLIQVSAKFKPLIWRCQIDDLNCSILLSEIDSLGKQNYIVDGKVEVTEATVTLKSKTFVRFYFIENADKGGIVGQRLKKAEDKAEETSGKLITPGITPTLQNTLQEKVVKNYPTTTHAQTVEYRLTNKLLIQKIYQSIDNTLLEYKAIPLVPGEWPRVTRSIILINQENKSDESE